MLRDFKQFVLRGNLVEIAVAFVMGLAFKDVVDRFVDLVTNLVAIPGRTEFGAWRFTVGGGVFRYGALLSAVLNFVIVAAVLFFFVVRPVNAFVARRRSGPEVDAPTKACRECLSSIPAAATRCAFCAVVQ
ncbi:MAG: large conductance mechanosensitive channel [Frankiaceae bacterium]|jgi:large conductance mechanosensitive channel|nr:large conductance mechanosensitive channel [Frankiaceae bacterium]